MSIIAKTNSTHREPIPAGNYIARCYQMIHIGTVMEFIPGQEQKLFNKVRIGWELPTELKVFKDENGEQPYVISEEYTLSMHEKANLRKLLASWRGKDFSEDEAKAFDITKLIGVQCMINVIHKASKKDASRIYEKIGSVSSVPKGLTCPPQINKTMVLSYDNFDYSIYDNLPDFIKDKIKGSLEYAAMQQPNSINIPSQLQVEPIDDLPF
jgi:hypothetical protein